MPVLETLGGALFGAVLQVLFDKLDSHQVLHYFRGRNLDEKLLKKLKRKLMDVNSVIDDAEQKQFTNSLVREWLDEVRDVLYDAEDLLEQIDYEFSKTKLEAEFHTSSSKVHNFESKIIALLDDLESLFNQNIVKDFKISSGVRSGLDNKVSEKKVESTSLVAEEVIYGRNEDKEIIFTWLRSDTNDNKLSILSIVGMGGMGKTTLAQHVYNDPKTEEAKFDEKAWVCVSDAFDVLGVSKAIIGAFTNKRDDSGDLEMVHGKLKKRLSGRKFLLVLDDVWNEDRNQWKALQTPLTFGAKGSKIVVTTRSHKVASIMQSTYIHQLEQLDEDHSWQTFAKHAFQDEKLNSEFKEIGMEIVEKCQGLPLALETIGCLLQSKSSVSEWEGVLTSEIWDLPIEDSKIVPTLLLSYYHLPSHLKRCFAYCALFPKDHMFDKERLILLWMAQNFLHCSQQNKSPEEVGENYFNDLVSRSFFKQIIWRNKTYFVMHDLLNDLAKHVSGEICYRLGVDDEKIISRKTRHIISYVRDPIEYYTSLWDAKGLRTFISFQWWEPEISIKELNSNFKFLRVLSFNRCFMVPDTIGDLIHLRSLDLSGAYIDRLPDSTCSLYNLQELKLNNCVNLVELPLTLHELTNLRRLELMGTTLRKAPFRLGKLKNLYVWMNEFEVSISSEFSIKQLGEPNIHAEKLSIKNLENISNPYETNLKNKTHIVGLSLQWNLKRNNDDSIKEREVLEYLQPPRHLKYLSIDGYGGTQFARWLSNNSLSNMVTLTLKNCKHCLWLPSLGHLTFLEDLRIDGLDWIGRIDADFYGNSSCAFASLKSLSFNDMKEWEEWQCMTGAFPSLQSLSLTNCAKLKGQLPDKLCHLKKLTIKDCGQLGAPIPSAEEMRRQVIYFRLGMSIPHWYYSLEELDISHGCDSLTTFPLCLFSILHKLCLSNCRNLQKISQGNPPNRQLKYLKIIECSEFESFPNKGLFAPQLQSFTIIGLEKLKSMPKCMSALLSSLDHLCIRDCPELELSEECLPSNVGSMYLGNCSKVVASLKGAWGTNPSLKVLSISDVDLECFPGEGLLPLSLSYLEIYDCPNLKKLDYRGLCHLSSLKILALNGCPILQCLPEESLPESISELRIKGCLLLNHRCNKQEGEDWEKIAHIKSIYVDGKEVNI